MAGKAKVRKLARPEPDERPKVSASAARRRRREVRILLGVGVALVVVVGGLVAYSMVGEQPTWQSVPIMASPHIPAITTPHPPYNSNPPTSGPHVGGLANWGVHYQPVPDELQVHSLEDKGVVIQYSCSPECPDVVEKLTAIVKRYNEFVLLAPRPGMDRRIALTAWGKIDKFDEFDEGRIVRFIKKFRGIDHHGEG